MIFSEPQFLIHGPCLLSAGDGLKTEIIQLIIDQLQAKIFCPLKSDLLQLSLYLESEGIQADVVSSVTSDSKSYLLGLHIDLNKPETYPLESFAGHQLWILPQEKEKYSAYLQLYYERKVEYILADFFPDEYEDSDYGEFQRWFYQHWLFWPGEWVQSKTFGEQKESLEPCSIAIPKEKPESWDSIEWITELYELASIDSTISIYDEQIEHAISSGSVLGHASDDSRFLKKQFYCRGKFFNDAALRSPLLNIIFEANTLALKAYDSVRGFFRSFFGKKTIRFAAFKAELINLFDLSYFESLKIFLNEGFNAENTIGSLHRCFRREFPEFLYELPLLVFHAGDANCSRVPKWIEDRVACRSFHAFYPELKQKDPIQADALLKKFVLGLLIQSHDSVEFQSSFRSAYLFYTDWLDLCQEAISEIKDTKVSKEFFYAQLIHFIQKGLLGKELGKDSDAGLLDLCEQLSSKTQNQMYFVYIAAERRQWDVVDHYFSKLVEPLPDRSWTELALIAFTQQDFSRAWAYFNKRSLAQPDASWQYVASMCFVEGIKISLVYIDNLYGKGLINKGFATHVAHSLFYQFPELYLGANTEWPLASESILTLIADDMSHSRAASNLVNIFISFVFALGFDKELSKIELDQVSEELLSVLTLQGTFLGGHFNKLRSLLLATDPSLFINQRHIYVMLLLSIVVQAYDLAEIYSMKLDASFRDLNMELNGFLEIYLRATLFKCMGNEHRFNLEQQKLFLTHLYHPYWLRSLKEVSEFSVFPDDINQILIRMRLGD